MADLPHITARFSGVCPDCETWWHPGAELRSELVDGLPVWRHAVCPDDAEPLKIVHAVCTICWLSHPPGQCDRQ